MLPNEVYRRLLGFLRYSGTPAFRSCLRTLSISERREDDDRAPSRPDRPVVPDDGGPVTLCGLATCPTDLEMPSAPARLRGPSRASFFVRSFPFKLVMPGT